MITYQTRGECVHRRARSSPFQREPWAAGRATTHTPSQAVPPWWSSQASSTAARQLHRFAFAGAGRRGDGKESQVAALFAHLGQPVQLKDAEEMSAVTPVTALMAPYYQLLDSVTKWMTAGGVRQQAASVFVGSLFHALSVDALKVQGAPRPLLFEELQLIYHGPHGTLGT